MSERYLFTKACAKGALWLGGGTLALSVVADIAGGAFPEPNIYPIVVDHSNNSGMSTNFDLMLFESSKGISHNITPSKESSGTLFEDAAISPNKKYVAMDDNQPGVTGSIKIIDLDNGDTKNITAHLGYSAFSPTWSGDSRKIAYMGLLTTNFGIEPFISTINSDGSDNKILIEGANPSWSKTQDVIIFNTSISNPGLPYLWSMKSDGSQLTELGLLGKSPVFSPNGDSFAYIDAFSKSILISSLSGDEQNRGFLSPDNGLVHKIEWQQGELLVVTQILAQGREVNKYHLMNPVNGESREVVVK